MLFHNKDGTPRSPLELIEDFDRHIAVFGELALAPEVHEMDLSEVFISLRAIREDHLLLV